MYVSQTYMDMVACLEEIYLTLNSWRYNQNEDHGWTIRKSMCDDTDLLDEKPPINVKCVT